MSLARKLITMGNLHMHTQSLLFLHFFRFIFFLHCVTCFSSNFVKPSRVLLIAEDFLLLFVLKWLSLLCLLKLLLPRLSIPLYTKQSIHQNCSKVLEIYQTYQSNVIDPSPLLLVLVVYGLVPKCTHVRVYCNIGFVLHGQNWKLTLVFKQYNQWALFSNYIFYQHLE